MYVIYLDKCVLIKDLIAYILNRYIKKHINGYFFIYLNHDYFMVVRSC